MPFGRGLAPKAHSQSDADRSERRLRATVTVADVRYRQLAHQSIRPIEETLNSLHLSLVLKRPIENASQLAGRVEVAPSSGAV